jgi:hypothetical protein
MRGAINTSSISAGTPIQNAGDRNT